MELLVKLVKGVLRLTIASMALCCSYRIRLYAVKNFGPVIHEFDPWFNYRAAEYLAAHGSDKFFKWFDHTVWYPLGRPVGTTIYPGMQFASVWIWQALDFFQQPMSLNDVCVFTPAWFGTLATIFLGFYTFECSNSIDAAICSAWIMAIIPAHIMRSVAGGYDNECVAISCVCATFFFWCRSLRTSASWPWGVITGLSYFCMVATWGGYIYVLNMIGVHCSILVVLGRFSSNLHRAYSLFFVIGTGLAIQVPVVGLTPLRSLEQMGPLGVFLLLQLLEFCEICRRGQNMSDKDFMAFRTKAIAACGALAAVVAALLFQVGYFGPISARVRGLFVEHTRTGNPLVDSVAEHQATSPHAYWQYLHYTCYLAPLGFVMSHGTSMARLSDGRLFMLLHAAITYYFSAKMNRLILLMGPICSALGGVAVSGTAHWAVGELADLFTLEEQDAKIPQLLSKGVAVPKAKAKAASHKANKKGPETETYGVIGEAFEPLLEAWNGLRDAYREAGFARQVAAALAMGVLLYMANDFYFYSQRLGEAMSQPSIMFMSRLSSGKTIIIDDYREAYWWLRDNTPEDSRVMAWWDYGYQINGVANRTTIADGNTWNHEHIATLGRCLTSPESKAHLAVRHLADYVLLWTGGGGDDLAKSPHMARIANSVYSDVCPGDPTCSSFSVDAKGNPTKKMAESLLWKLHGHNQKKGVHVNPKLFQEAYTSKYNMVRIYKVLNVSTESKAWAMDPANFQCDAPGSWYCKGRYPPALSKLIETRKNFKQLEDFNTGSLDKEAEEYQKAYHARMEQRR